MERIFFWTKICNNWNSYQKWIFTLNSHYIQYLFEWNRPKMRQKWNNFSKDIKEKLLHLELGKCLLEQQKAQKHKERN